MRRIKSWGQTGMLAWFLFLTGVAFCEESVSTQPEKTASSPGQPPNTNVASKTSESPSPVLWHCLDAIYRVELLTQKEGTSFFDDRSIVLPASIGNGVRVLDANGVRVPCHQYENGGVLIASLKQGTRIFLYFGFPEKQPCESLPDAGKNTRLLLQQLDPKTALLPADWPDQEIAKCREAIRNSAKWSKPYPECNHTTECRILRNAFTRCRNAPFSFCGQNIAFRGFGANSMLYQARPLFMNCCIAQPLHPDYLRTPIAHDQCKPWATVHALKNYQKVKSQNLAKIRTIKETNPEDGLENTLFDAFPAHARQMECPQIFLAKHPFDTEQKFAILYQGNLNVPESADYEFQVKSNSTRILRLDGTSLIREFGEVPGSEAKGSEQTKKIHLERGIHRLDLVYYKHHISTWLAASWRRVGEPRFRPLSEEDFSPGTPLTVCSISSQAGLRYPIFSRSDKFALYTAKRQHFIAHEFSSRNGDEFCYHWELASGKQHYTSRQNTILISSENKDADLVICPEEAGFAPLPVRFPRRTATRIPVVPDLSIRVWAPWFFFRDETLEFTTEIRSRLPLSLSVEWESSELVNGKQTNVESRIVDLPSCREEQAGRFAPDHSLYDSRKLNGSTFDSRIVTYVVRVPGLEFDRTELRILPMDQIEDFSVEEDGFYDKKGARIVPFLARPTLHNLRLWQVPKKLNQEFSPVRKVLVIGEQFGDFREELTRELQKHHVELEFAGWVSDGKSMGRPVLQSLPELFRLIKQTNAELALVIPPTQSRRTTVSARDQLRGIAFLLQALRTCSSVTRIALAPPMPSHPARETDEEDFTNALRDYKRTYGIELLELQKEYGEKLSPADYREGGLVSAFPDQKSEELAKLFAAFLFGKQ